VDADSRAARSEPSHAGAAVAADHLDGGRLGGLDRHDVPRKRRLLVPGWAGNGVDRWLTRPRALLRAERLDAPPALRYRAWRVVGARTCFRSRGVGCAAGAFDL